MKTSTSRRSMNVTEGHAAVRRAWIMTYILASMSVMSFLDRQVLALLIPDLRRDLGIDDIQAGWLIGPAFIIVYNLALIPASILADRLNRVKLIAAGVTIWSVLTILSGLATSYEQLLILRSGVAVGEALLGPAAISIIGDLFAREHRPLPTGTYITGSVIGSTGSSLMTAAILDLAQRWTDGPLLGNEDPWRLTLFAVGIPGIVLTLMLVAFGREPLRGGSDNQDQHWETFRAHLARRWQLYLLAFSALSIFLLNLATMAIWGPTYLIRRFAFSQVEAGYRIGAISMVAGVAGTVFLAMLIRRLVAGGKIGLMVNVTVLLMLLSGGALYAFGTASSFSTAAVAAAVAMLLLCGIGVLPTLVVQLYVPDHLRGRVVAGVFFLLYLLSSAAPVLVPALAHGPERTALGISIGQIGLVTASTSALLFWLVKPFFLAAEREK